MTIRKREQNRRAFAAMLKERTLTRATAAELLYVSIDTMNAWLKPETSKSSLPVPPWAPELLGFKVPHPDGKRHDDAQMKIEKAYRANQRPVRKRAAR